MIDTPPPEVPSGKPKAAKRSALDVIFNTHWGASFDPLKESTGILLQLIAGVFAIYGLLPKDYPGLNDSGARLSFRAIFASAWQNVRFTREGVPQAILFFAVIGVIVFGVLAVISSLLSLFIGHAHAADACASSASTSIFTAPCPDTDLAQTWISFLFLGAQPASLTAYSSDYMNSAVPATMNLQTALTQAVLPFYSDAILVVAGIILFYHLASMVVETAHSGVPMGDKARQIWAPIRLVVAIGLLVPVSGGLNSGQYIVIKMAEMGSGLASNAWDIFLNYLSTYSTTPVLPAAPIVTQIANDLVLSEACVADYNARVTLMNQQISGSNISTIPTTGIEIDGQTIGGQTGTKYSFSSPDLGGQDMCGWYFIPDNPYKDPTSLDVCNTTSSSSDAATCNADTAAGLAYTAESQTLSSNFGAFVTEGSKIVGTIPTSDGGTYDGTTPITLSNSTLSAVIAYQQAATSNLTALAAPTASEMSTVVKKIEPYGWVFAGTFLPTVEREQSMISDAIKSGMPQAQAPQFDSSALGTAGSVANGMASGAAQGSAAGGSVLPIIGNIIGAITGSIMGGLDAATEVSIGQKISSDISNFGSLISKGAAQTTLPSDQIQCASMLGLQDQTQGWFQSFGAWSADAVMGIVDHIATLNGVWTAGTGAPCSSGGTTNSTFQLGVTLSGPDIVGQMINLGHANVNTALGLYAVAFIGQAAGGVIAMIPYIGNAVNSILTAFMPLLTFLAMIFWVCGFTLAYVLPMIPFSRFLFAVISWVGALAEAVVAVPLVALAHLSPEGHGLPGGAQKAYYFVFNIFLRPILMVLGLITGLLAFMVGANFLTYTFSLAVAAAGGTANGPVVLSKFIFTVLYCFFMYILADHAFAMIEHLPKNALNWMGQQGQSMPELGDAGKMQGIVTAVGDYAVMKSADKVEGLAKNVDKGVTAGANYMKGKLSGPGDSASPGGGSGALIGGETRYSVGGGTGSEGGNAGSGGGTQPSSSGAASQYSQYNMPGGSDSGDLAAGAMGGAMASGGSSGGSGSNANQQGDSGAGQAAASAAASATKADTAATKATEAAEAAGRMGKT